MKKTKPSSLKRETEKQLTSPDKYKMIFSSDAYKSLFEHHPDMVIILGAKGDILALNRSSYGRSEEDIKNLTFHQFIEQEYITDTLNMIRLALRGETTELDLRLIHANGTSIPVHATFIPIKQEEEVIGMYAIVKDITEWKQQEKLVSKIRTDLDDVQRIGNIGSFDYDVIEDESFWSNQVYQIYNIDEDIDFVPTSETIHGFIHPDDRNRVEQVINEALETGKSYQIEYCIQLADGVEKYVSEQTDVILDENGKAVRLIGTLLDNTIQKQIETQLQESQEQFETIANSVDLTIWSMDRKLNRLTFCSDGARELYGVEPSQLLQNPTLWKEFIFPDDRPLVLKHGVFVERGEKVKYQHRIIDANGKVKWVENQTIPVKGPCGELIRVDGFIKDITAEKQQNKILEDIAYHDYLTKLPNRRLFEKKLQEVIDQAKEKNKQFAVFFLDLDRFTYVNDTFGHENGDKLLNLFAARLTRIMNENTFLSRIGGDEFTFYMNHIESVQECVEMAEAICNQMEEPFAIGDYELVVSASIGISLFPENGQTIHEMLKCADLALFKSKEMGKNGWHLYKPSMNKESIRLHQLEMDLRKAINNDEFFMEYQPKVDAKTGRIKGAEALIRWAHPKIGRVSPAEFIPLAEESGLIIPIGDWVLRTVCAQLKQWQTEGYPVVPVSINVPPIRLFTQGYIESLLSLLKRLDLDPTWVEIELTERSMILNQSVTKSVISQLKQAGIRFALDDFGTGYSSLTYLKDFPVDILKIDKSFIDGILTDDPTKGILKGLLFMASELKMDIVAEGVETMEQLQFLKKYPMQIQGYIYSKPVGGEQFAELLTRQYLPPNK